MRRFSGMNQAGRLNGYSLAMSLVLLLLSGQTQASDACLLDRIKQSDKARSVGDILSECEQQSDSTPDEIEEEPVPTALKRLQQIRENAPEYEPFSLIPHRVNYMMPVYMTDQINRAAYQDVDIWDGELSDIESKYQLSLKVPLHYDVFTEGDGFYWAFTVEAWWQTYNTELSRPFRETNYRPEFFYQTPLSFKLYGYETDLVIGFEHQSNGRDQTLSRSWNRLFSELRLTKDNHQVFIRPWYRIPEDEKEFVGDPEGDDNPDIGHFMGNFEAGGAYSWQQDYELNYKFRRNFAREKGAVELAFIFPLWGKVRGYTSIFHGYGDSMIDYNHSQTRVGIGFALNDFF